MAIHSIPPQSLGLPSMPDVGNQKERSISALSGMEGARCDVKGRILISKKNRDKLGATFAMAISDIGCLTIYPEREWLKRVEEIDSFPTISKGRDDFSRLIMQDAEDGFEFDGQGRVGIPERFREMGGIGLGDELILSGCGNRIEVWPLKERQRFEKEGDNYNRERRELFEAAYNRMLASKGVAD
jgi:division/cell wall cluster transcriptional repressor MraZ